MASGQARYRRSTRIAVVNNIHCNVSSEYTKFVCNRQYCITPSAQNDKPAAHTLEPYCESSVQILELGQNRGHSLGATFCYDTPVEGRNGPSRCKQLVSPSSLPYQGVYDTFRVGHLALPGKLFWMM